MEDFFFIPNHNIDSAWNPLDRSLDLFVLEYCEEVLNIPIYLIEDVKCIDDGMEIELKDIEPWMIKEDWYIHLFRVSNFVRVS
jgi:hypothetical protein